MSVWPLNERRCSVDDRFRPDAALLPLMPVDMLIEYGIWSDQAPERPEWWLFRATIDGSGKMIEDWSPPARIDV